LAFKTTGSSPRKTDLREITALDSVSRSQAIVTPLQRSFDFTQLYITTSQYLFPHFFQRNCHFNALT
jgi:hypothetical protein